MHFNIRGKLLFFLVLFYFSSAFGQTYRFIDYKEQQRFDQSQILSMFQDSWGFLWIGTGNGLFRYDGEDWLRFALEEGLPDIRITAIVEDDSLHLWIGTGFGLACLDIEDYNNPVICDVTADFEFQHLINNMYYWNKTLWIGTLSNGMFRVKNRQIYPPRTGSVFDAPNVIFNFYKLDDSRLAVIVQKKGFFIVNNNVNIIDKFIDFKNEEIVSMCTGGGKEEIILGGNKNLYKLNLKSRKYVSVLPRNIARQNPYFFKIVSDQDGVIWAATNIGLIRRSGDLVELITTKNGLPALLSRNIIVDRENNLWIGSNSAGLFKLTDRDMLAYDQKAGLISGVVNSITTETTDRKLLGTDAGVFIIEKNRLYRDKRFSAIDNEVVWKVYQDRQKRIWAVGENLLSYYEKGNFYANPYPEIVQHNTVIDIYQDIRGNYWLGTGSGLYLLTKSGWKIYHEYGGKPIRNISSIKETKDGRIFFGTDLGLLIRHEKGISYFTNSNGLPARTINDVFEAKDGTIWLASDYGLIKMDGEDFQLFGKEAGLGGVYITQIMEDKMGIIWLCANNGLYRFNGEAVTAVLNKHDGLIGDEFVTRNSSLIDSDGRFWLGLFGGLSVLHPQKILEAPQAAPILMIKKAQAYKTGGDFTSFARKQNSTIPFSQKNIVFDFTGLYFRSEQDLSFEYRLTGMDELWDTIGRAGEVRYHNLWPGKYVLQVRSLIDNRFVGEEVELAFEIDKPFWMKSWFIITLSVFLLSTIYLFIYFQTKWMKRRQTRLEKVIKIRTKELERTKSQLESIIENAGSAIVTVNKTGGVKTWNKRAETVFGYSKNEILEQDIRKLDLSGDDYPFIDIIDETDKSSRLSQLELKKLAKDKREIDLMLTATHQKGDEYCTIVMEDFTERNQLVQSMMNRENLLGAISALNKLLVTLSHYINNALMAITGMSQLSKMDKKFINRFIETTDNQALRIQAVMKSLSDLVQSLNLKTRQYAGDVSLLFDIENEIKAYIELIDEDIAESGKPATLNNKDMDRNDVY